MSTVSGGSVYLCYDIRGIQQFIFSVPKLKYVVGASALIWQFDEEHVGRAIDALEGSPAELIFSGGGRGTIRCRSTESAEQLKRLLVAEAHRLGLDLRIGIDADIGEALRGAEELYPFVPDSLEGEPCRASGLWPITLERSAGFASDRAPKGIHPKVWLRRSHAVERTGSRNRDVLGNRIIEAMHKRLPEDLSSRPLTFFTLVKDDEELEREQQEAGRAAERALGNRNRWAVLAMDGNDMGAQFRAFGQRGREETEQWLTSMSRTLKQCTWEALGEALAEMVTDWWENEGRDCREEVTNRVTGEVVLPFRPLIAGGDDVICLCHCAYAMPLAIGISRKFSDKSAAAEHADRLWPATGGRLTISGGIAYTSVNLPLYSSIPYAESLLASAKGGFRRHKPKNQPTPAALDWEHITESMLDTPAARRNRDLRFHDADCHDVEIVLTRRPYAIESELGSLLQLQERLAAAIPRSVLAEALHQFRRPWSDRVRWLAGTMKHHRQLDQWLREWPEDGGTWDLGSTWRWEKEPAEDGTGGRRSTSFIDAVLLLEERHRMTQRQPQYV